MRYNLTAAVLLLGVSFVVGTGCDGVGPRQEKETEGVALSAGDAIPGQFIVVLKDRSTYASKTVEQVVTELTTYEGVTVNHRYNRALVGFSGQFTDEAIDRIRENPFVDYVEPDRVVSLPPITIEGGKASRKPPKDGGDTSTQPAEETPWGITRVGSAGDGTLTGVGTAWIIDTGVDLDHPDLNVDAARSVSMLGGKESNNPDDQNGHGTHVAGTIAAIANNGVGVVGVAAGATVVSVRVLDRRGSGWLSDVIKGVEYVADNGSAGDVANMSLGGGESQALDDAVVAASAKVQFALAAGNESDDASNHSPARAEGNNIYTISAMNSSNNFAYFSNWGPPVDYTAPGVSILSLWKSGGTNTISGTSMAAPHVAGILLLGAVTADGTVNGDPDGKPDPIAHR